MRMLGTITVCGRMVLALLAGLLACSGKSPALRTPVSGKGGPQTVSGTGAHGPSAPGSLNDVPVQQPNRGGDGSAAGPNAPTDAARSSGPDAVAENAKDGGRGAYPGWPSGCDVDPGGRVYEDGMGLAAVEDSSAQLVPDNLGIWAMTITPDSRTVFDGGPPTIDFAGPTGRGAHGHLGFALDPHFTTTDLVGRTLTIKGVTRVLSCTGGPGGEAAAMSVKALRDESGELLVVAAPATETDADGKVFFEPSSVPEITVRWVSMPAEACEWRRTGLELTVVKTGQKAVGAFQRRAELQIGGQAYVLATGRIATPPLGYCGGANWIMYRKGFLTSVPGVPDPPSGGPP